MQAATSSGNNNNQGVYIPPQQPVMYGHTGQGYDPAAIPLAHVGGEGKPYTDNTGYYPPPPQQGGKSDRTLIYLLAFLSGGGGEEPVWGGKRGMHMDGWDEEIANETAGGFRI